MTKLQPFLSKIDGGVPLLIALPWFLLLINGKWIFTPAATIDPWLYFGYFNNFGQYTEWFPATYYATRLPWIVPGYICYKVFPPLIANHVLHVGFYYIAVFSLYYILKQTTNNRTALLISILMGFYPFFLGAVGWDYIDGAGIAYFLLTMLLLTLAAKNLHRPKWTVSFQRYEETARTISTTISFRSSLMLFLAGVSLAAFIYTNTFLILFTPVMALYYIIVNYRYRKDSLVTSLLFVIIGFATLTILLGIINMAAGGNFLFFLPSFSFAFQMFKQSNPWRISGYTWLEQATWLVLPTMVFIGSLASLIYIFMKKAVSLKTYLSQFPGIFILCYILLFLIMLLMELKGDPVLQLTYYASYLIPALFLAAGGAVSTLVMGTGRRKFYWLLTALIILLIVASLQSTYSFFTLQSSILCPMIVIAITISGIMVLRLRPEIINTKLLAFLFLLFGIFSFSVTDSHFTVNYVTNQWRSKQIFQSIVESEAIFSRFDTTGDLRFWYSGEEPLGSLYVSIASVRLWGYRLINDSFPTLANSPVVANPDGIVQIEPGTRIVILSNDENAFEMANASLGQINRHAVLIQGNRIKQGDIEFTMTFIVVKANE